MVGKLLQTRGIKDPVVHRPQHFIGTNNKYAQKQFAQRKRRLSSIHTRAGNLGALEHLAQPGTNIEFALPDLQSFEGGARLNGPAAFGSVLLLIILLGIAFERVLGLDRLFAKLILKLKWRKLARQRSKDIAERERLERIFKDDSDP